MGACTVGWLVEGLLGQGCLLADVDAPLPHTRRELTSLSPKYKPTPQRICTGRHVVRLKIGDPFLFGRGGEEVHEYRGFGVEPQVGRWMGGWG